MDNTELIRSLRSAAATTGLDAYVELMQRAADALSAIRPIAAPVTDDEIDAAFDALGLIRESTTAKEVCQALAGFAAGRATSVDWSDAHQPDGLRSDQMDAKQVTKERKP